MDRPDLLELCRVFLEALGGLYELGVVGAARAAGAVAVFGDFQADAESAEMRDLTEKIHRGFGVAIFELAIRGTHAAKRADLTFGADGFAGGRDGADFLEAAFPAFAETAGADVVAVLVREDTDGHAAGGINRAAVVATAAGVAFVGHRTMRNCTFLLEEFSVFGHADGIAEFQGHGLFRGEPDIQGALRTVGARIDEGIKF